MRKCASAQVRKCALAQVRKCASARVPVCTSVLVRVCVCARVRVCMLIHANMLIYATASCKRRPEGRPGTTRDDIYIYIYSVRYFLKTAYVMILPTRGRRSDAEVFRIDFIIGGYWRTAREGRA